MRFEVLKRSNLKRNIMIGVVVVAIIVACIITLTRAKYRSVASTTLIKGEVNYTLADLNLVAVYIQQDDESYAQDKEIPTSGYTFNAEDSYCTVDGEIDDSITLSYDSTTQSLSVSPITTQGTKCYLYFDLQGTLLSDAILRDNGTPKTNPTLDATSCEYGSNKTSSTTYNDGNCGVSENGLYQGEDDYGTTYYYRGTVNNNWVSFAGFYWRIIRINGDGTVRLIYSGEGSPAETGTNTLIFINVFNEDYDASSYVGYTYTTNSQRQTTGESEEDSTIKEKLDDWYEEYLEPEYASYIADSGFCNDRQVTSGTWRASGSGSNFYYAAYTRDSSGTPTFKCYKDSNADGSGYADLYTVNNDDGIGNGALENPIGLITADEVMYAGAYSSTINYGYWLYTGSTYWTMSPSRFYATGNAFVFYVTSTGYLTGLNVVNTFGVRPVINLSANVTISSGDGTIDNVYIVKTQ